MEIEVPELTLQVRAGWGAQGPLAPQIQCSHRTGVVGAGAELAAPPSPRAVFPNSSPCNNRQTRQIRHKNTNGGRFRS